MMLENEMVESCLEPYTVQNVRHIKEVTFHSVNNRKTVKAEIDEEALASELNKQFWLYKGWVASGGIPTRKQTKDRLKSAFKQTEAAVKSYDNLKNAMESLSKLGLSKQIGHLADALDVQINELSQLQDSFDRVWEMIEGADHCLLDSREQKAGKLYNKTDFMGRVLPQVYEDFFLQERGISTNHYEGDSRSGPMVRFVIEVMQVAGEIVSGENVRNAYYAAQSPE